jgi:hypothetical protein
LVGSKYAITVALVRAAFTALRYLACLVLQQKGTFFLVNSRKGSVRSLKLGINFAQYVIIPRKLRTALIEFGGGQL